MVEGLLHEIVRDYCRRKLGERRPLYRRDAEACAVVIVSW